MKTKSRATKRALCERMCREGATPAEIAKAMGWSDKHPPTHYLAIYRARGWNIPHIYTKDRIEASVQERWPDR